MSKTERQKSTASSLRQHAAVKLRRSMRTRLELIKSRFGEDKDRISKETSVLYEQVGVHCIRGHLCSCVICTQG